MIFPGAYEEYGYHIKKILYMSLKNSLKTLTCFDVLAKLW